MYKHYNISEHIGCMLEIDEAKFKLSEKFKPWVEIGSHLPELIRDRKLRDEVHNMPLLSCDEIQSYIQLRHAHMLLALITNCYVWQDGDEGKPESIPAQLSVPLVSISKRVGLQPIICHADVVLTNYRLIDSSKPPELRNLELRYHISDEIGNDWFFLVTMQVELECSAVYKIIGECLEGIAEDNCERLIACLHKLVDAIELIRAAFLRMHEKLNASSFYNKLRPFLNGWHESGLVYEGVCDDPIKAYGGSAAQCTGIQALDILLGVHHSKESDTFLRKMRDYMPLQHQAYLSYLEGVRNVKDYVEGKDMSHTVLHDAFNGCVEKMVSLRSTHIQIVTKYITIQAAQIRNDFSSLRKQGTGGQKLIPFLKEIRSTTEVTKVKSKEKITPQ